MLALGGDVGSGVGPGVEAETAGFLVEHEDDGRLRATA